VKYVGHEPRRTPAREAEKTWSRTNAVKDGDLIVLTSASRSAVGRQNTMKIVKDRRKALV